MIPVKVLEVIRQGQIGGGESHLIDLIAGFESVIEPVVLAFTPGQMIDTLRERGIVCYVIETSNAFDFSVLGKIKEILIKEEIRIIHAHGSRAASNMILLSKYFKIPMIYTVHGWSFHQDQSKLVGTIRIASEKILCALSKKVICVSESNRVTGEKAFGLHNAMVIENGINLQKFNPQNKFKDIRKELGISPDDFVIGFIGRVTEQKDPFTFVKSLEIAHSKEPAIKGLFVGSGNLKDDVMKYIKEQHLENFIFTSEFRTDIPDLLNTLDVFCLPSLWEGLSIALLEAMAMKRAVLVTPTDGTSEIIQNDVNGTITEFSNSTMLAENMIKYFSDKTRLQSHGEKAMQLIKNRFDSKNVSMKVTELYLNILH
jgi:glycosyltransferase involved in cell wall biosynthesis